MKRLDQLTVTRFMAVFLVLVYHATAEAYIQPLNFFPFAPLFYAAPTAVSYLYVLSGFVMSLVYYKPQERFDIRGYWSARFVRIYPMYILSFLLICLYYLEYMPRIKALKILANIFVVQAWVPDYAQSFNYPTWSLCVEFFFYAVFPFFTIWAYRQSMRRLIWISVAVWVVSQTIYQFLWIRYFPELQFFIVYFPMFHLNSFILGVVGGIWFMREGTVQKYKKQSILIILAVCILLVALFTIAGKVYPWIPHDLQPMAGLLSPLFVVIILALALDQSRLSNILKHPWLVLLGETAFILYVFEVPFVWFYERGLSNSSFADPDWVLRWTALPIILLIGIIGHLFIDRPIRKWLKNILQRVSMPVLLLDLVAVALSVWLSFLIRFGTGKDFREFTTAGFYMFWLAFIVRIIMNVSFNSVNPQLFDAPFKNMLRRLFLSVSTGSVVIAALVWLEFRLGWIPGWPRSVFLLDWAFMIILSVIIRMTFRTANRVGVRAALT